MLAANPVELEGLKLIKFRSYERTYRFTDDAAAGLQHGKGLTEYAIKVLMFAAGSRR